MTLSHRDNKQIIWATLTFLIVPTSLLIAFASLLAWSNSNLTVLAAKRRSSSKCCKEAEHLPVLTRTPLLIERNDLINYLHFVEAATLRLADNLWVPTLLYRCLASDENS
jgi:hypothetical protein